MMRIDLYLVNQGYARSRSIAQKLIEANVVFVDGRQVVKVSTLIDDNIDHEVQITDNFRYVSRGGYKLEGILKAAGIDPSARICIDIGASTGGFTDCLLQSGAEHVYCVDSGVNQLAESIAEDTRVTVLEKTNARNLDTSMIPELADIIVMDVSFISQTLIHPIVDKFLFDDGVFVSLIKPQFELTKSEIGKGGIVKTKSDRHAAVRRVVDSCAENNLFPIMITDSPIKGGDGNIEYTAVFARNPKPSFDVTVEINKLS